MTSIFTITAETALALCQNYGADIGATLPEALTDDVQKLDDVREASAAVRPETDSRVTIERVLAALDAGSDPFDDPRVVRAALRQALGGSLQLGLDAALEQRRAELVVAHAPAIVESWRPVFEKAKRSIVKAHDQVPGADLTTDSGVVGLAPRLMSVWGEARAATHVVDRIATMWGTLSAATGRGAIAPGRQPLVVADLDLEDLVALHEPTARAAAQAGRNLSLATFEEYTDRVARVVAAEAARTERRARERAEWEGAMRL